MSEQRTLSGGDERPRQEVLLVQDPELYLLSTPQALQPAMIFLSEVVGSDPATTANAFSGTLKDLREAQSPIKLPYASDYNVKFMKAADYMLRGGQIGRLGLRVMGWYETSISLLTGSHEPSTSPPLSDWKANLDGEMRTIFGGNAEVMEGPLTSEAYAAALEKAGGEQVVRQSATDLFDECAMQAHALNLVEVLVSLRQGVIRTIENDPVLMESLEVAWKSAVAAFHSDIPVERKQKLILRLSNVISQRHNAGKIKISEKLAFGQLWTSRREGAFMQVCDVLAKAVDGDGDATLPTEEDYELAPILKAEQERKEAELRALVQPIADEHYELTKDWVMPSAKQARRSGYLAAFNALRGRAPQGEPHLEPAVKDDEALVIVGAMHRLQQALGERHATKWLRGVLQREQSLQERYEDTVPEDEQETDMLYATFMTSYLHDNWERVAPLFEKILDSDKLEAIRELLVGALCLEAEKSLSPTERIMRALGRTGLAGRVQMLDLQPILPNAGNDIVEPQKKQNVTDRKREVARQLNVDPELIRDERMRCFLDICQELGPEVEVFIVNHSDIGDSKSRLAFRNYLVAVFDYEEGRKAFYAENILADDRASYIYTERPDWPWRTVLALRKADVQSLGGIQVIHPPGDDPDSDRKHAELVKKVLFGY